jgi:acrylyl-CoA reductase (NADPH)
MSIVMSANTGGPQFVAFFRFCKERMITMDTFKALVARKIESGIAVAVSELTMEDLPIGDVTIRVRYASINYKDGLAAAQDGQVVKSYPMVPGVDLAGEVVASGNPRFREGDQVLATGYELGISHYGGYSEYARIPSDWIVPLPDGLTPKQAMALGTAGFTAALSILRLEQNGLTPDKGLVLVTGATGGVGSLAVAMLANLGYQVAASTGKETEHDYLRSLGAQHILTRAEVSPEQIRPLDKQKWAGAVDPVGGRTLAYVLSTMQYGGSVAVSGLTGGAALPASVYPFILRGINLLGIDSVYCPMRIRLELWERMARDVNLLANMAEITREITLNELPDALEQTIKGTNQGRTIVAL